MWITNSDRPTNNPQGNKKQVKKDNFDFKLQDSLSYESVYLKQHWQSNANKDAVILINISLYFFFFGSGFIILEDNKLKLPCTFSQKV